VSITVLRVQSEVPVGVPVTLLLASGGLLYWLGAQAHNEGGKPTAYQSVLLATGLPLLFAGLFLLFGSLAGYLDPPPAWVFMVASAVTGALALWPALERNSAISLLLAAILGGTALIAAWSAIFGSTSAAPYRWLMAAYAGGLVLGSLALREPARRHAEVLIDAAALAIAFIGLTAFIGPFEAEADLPWFWEIVLLGAGFGLTAFGALDRSPGPAYLGVLNLVLFIFAAAFGGEGATLYWWPLFLLAGGGVMLVAGLRPRRPLPPEPDPYRAGEAPFAARADDREIVIRVHND